MVFSRDDEYNALHLGREMLAAIVCATAQQTQLRQQHENIRRCVAVQSKQDAQTIAGIRKSAGIRSKSRISLRQTIVQVEKMCDNRAHLEAETNAPPRTFVCEFSPRLPFNNKVD